MSIHRRQTSKGVRYDVHLRDENGRQYQRVFRTKKEAEAFDAKEQTDRARGAWVDPRGGATPFGAVAAEWLTSNPASARVGGLVTRPSCVFICGRCWRTGP